MAKERPLYRVVMWHSDNAKDRTEVGAVWAFKDKDKPGGMLAIKRGISLHSLKDVRICILPITDRDDDGTGTGHDE